MDDNNPTMVLNDQGGQQMSVSYDVVSTLRSQMKHHEPIVFNESGADEEVIPINTMVGTRETPETRTTFGVGNPGDPQFTISAAHSHAVFSAGFSFGQSAKARSLGYQEETSPTLRGGEGGNQKPCVVEIWDAVPIENHPNDSRAKICEDGVVQTLSGRMGTGGNNTPLIMERVLPFDTTQITSPYNYSHPHEDDPCHPLASTAHPPAIAFTQNQREEVRDLNDKATAINADPGMHQQTYVATCIGNGQADIASHITEETAQTLSCMHDQLAIHTYGLDRAAYNQGQNARFDFSVEEESAPTPVSRGPGAVCTAVDCRNGTENPNVNGTLMSKETGYNNNSNQVARVANTVRRLTPKECERLQSFPDNWTSIGEWVDSKGKKHKDADTPRYKALGNSIALPFWFHLLRQISAQYPDETPTLGSLFDGIGGFPLCWETINGKGTALWASEIEEFPIAVTKLRFPEKGEE